MEYDEELDEWFCANGKRLIFQFESQKKSENGYDSAKRTTRCNDCMNCPFQISCAKDKDTKTVQVSVKNQQQRKEVRERLAMEEGTQKYSQRKIDVEPVFGQIKHNRAFKRFGLRGLSKNTTDWGLICVAHNLLKWSANTENEQIRIIGEGKPPNPSQIHQVKPKNWMK